MWVLYVLIGLFTTINGWTIEAVYSGFSNLVTSIPVGSPTRPLKLSVDFARSESFLYDGRTDCPAFVGDCYDPSLSESFVLLGDCDVREWESCQESSDVFSLESESHAFNFKLLSQSSGSSVAMREVAGMLSLDPTAVGSVKFQSAVFDDNLPGLTISSDLEPRDLDFLELSDDWAFSASFAGTAAVVRFDPKEEVMLLPLDLEQRMLAAIAAQGVAVTGSKDLLPRTVACDASFHLTIGTVELSERVLLDSECRLRYMLAVSDEIIIGRQLLESVESVIVDVVGKIGFVPNSPETDEDRKWFPSLPLIPILSPDFVTVILPTESVMDMNFGLRIGRTDGLFLWQFPDSGGNIRLVSTEGGPEIDRKRTAAGRWILDENSPYLTSYRLKFRFLASQEFGKVVIVHSSSLGTDVSLVK